jgi:2-isopropylmalate synthase
MEQKMVEIYDTTLRDGAQAEGISFSVDDKLMIAHALDEIGIHYIEGGWPGANPKDIMFFERVKEENFANSHITAFGSTRKAGNPAEDDPNLLALVEADVSVVTIFGKSWDLHVKEALKVSLEENLDIIGTSIEFLKKHVGIVFYDAEHFFDGYKDNPEYAMQTLKVASEASADCLVLCDTNGGTLPFDLMEIIRAVRKGLQSPLGIHVHNDSGMAVANSILASHLGVDHIQGTINGYGERCGNADLCSIIPNVMLKEKKQCIAFEQLERLTSTSRYVAEIANLKHWDHQPFVGNSAFAHKGGVHVDAIQKNPKTYEHIDPLLVGNYQRVLISELSGKGNVFYKAKEYGIDVSKDSPGVRKLLAQLKELEKEGYQFEGAEGSFKLLMRKALDLHRDFFESLSFRVIVGLRGDDAIPTSEAIVKVKVGQKTEHTVAEGDGPVNALDNALRKALEQFFPTLQEVELVDYKVRILDESSGTAAKTRVLIESKDHEDVWGTVGVSTNIIEASWEALVDSIEYKLMKDEEKTSSEDPSAKRKEKSA